MAKVVKKPRKKATNGYKMPDPLSPGEILTDIAKKQWKLGTSIGKGGFGEIYSAQELSTKSSKYPSVVKVEPHENGPLFVEMHFYMKNAKQADVEKFMQKHKLHTFGMPLYLGSGSHEVGPTKYRFIVMEKFGSDIDNLRAHKTSLPPATVFQLAWQLSYVLEYIHECGYIHADIKGGNVLMGTTPSTKNQSYLLDFGLAAKFSNEKDFKPNPKKAHDGTIEYLSRDGHQGVPTRRGDFEILGYNLIHWLGGTLPWDSKLTDPKTVQQIKETNMSDIPKFVKTSLKTNQDTLVMFLKYVNNLKFNEKPDYKKIRKMFEGEVLKNGVKLTDPLDFQGMRKRRSRVSEDEENIESDVILVEKKKPVRKVERKKKEDVEQLSGEILTPAMREILERKKHKEAEKKKPKGRSVKNGLNGYNAEMLEVQEKLEERRSKSRSPEIVQGRPKRTKAAYNYDERSPRK